MAPGSRKKAGRRSRAIQDARGTGDLQAPSAATIHSARGRNLPKRPSRRGSFHGAMTTTPRRTAAPTVLPAAEALPAKVPHQAPKRRSRSGGMSPVIWSFYGFDILSIRR
jgi:hypothetical protein